MSYSYSNIDFSYIYILQCSMIPLHYKLKEKIKLLYPLPPKQCGTLQIICIHKQEPQWYGSKSRKDITTGLYRKSLTDFFQAMHFHQSSYIFSKQIEGP